MTISQNPKEKKKKNPLSINLKYNKYLFSLKIHFPKTIVDFFIFKEKKITNEYLLFENLRPKVCEISPRKNKKKSVAANSYKP
jgi:hypothetical protein